MDEVVEPAPDLQERFRVRLESHRSSRAGTLRPRSWLWQPRGLAALGALAAVLMFGILFVSHEEDARVSELGLSEVGTVDQLPLLQEMDIIQNLELLEDFDAIAVLAENGESPSTIQ
jgi:hypothetical protein